MRCLFAFLLILTFMPQAYAADINDQGAASLKSTFTKMLDLQTKTWEAQDGMQLEKQGELTVEQAGSYYAITFPHIQVRHNDGSRLELGIISANASPHDTPGQWKMTFALPTPMRFYDRQGNETWRIDVKGQQSAGIFHDEFLTFSKLDATYNDITIDTLGDTITSIENIVLRFDFDEDANKNWSGPGYIEANAVKSKGDNKGTTVNIGNIKAAFNMDQYNPKIGLDYQNRFLALQDQGAFDTPELSEAHSKELASAIFDLYTKGMNGFDMTYGLSDLSIKKPAAQDGTQEEFKIGHTSFSLDIGGFLEQKAKLGFNFGYDGFALSSIPQEKQDILPSTANFDIRINDIPFAQLVQSVQNALAGAGNNLQVAGFGLLVRVPALLSQSGTNVTIIDNHLGNDIYRMDLNGKVVADIAAAASATANAKLVFKGLEALLAKTTSYAQDPEVSAEDVQKLKQISATLEWLKTLSIVDTDANGDVIHNFEFVLDPQGQMLLNGHDVRTLQPGVTPQ